MGKALAMMARGRVGSRVKARLRLRGHGKAGPGEGGRWSAPPYEGLA